MKIQLSDHFTYRRLLRFVLPSIVMMIFTSIYSVVDGLFVSNFVGKTAFAAVNLVMPYMMGLSALGFMIGTGGSAIVARTLGEGRQDKANAYFSMLVYVMIVGGLVLSAVCCISLPAVCRFLGAEGELLANSVMYGRISSISLTAFMLQNVFQSFFVTAEKPQLGLAVVVAAGVANMVLDYLFIAVFGLGLAGAALATVTGECIGGLFPLVYFGRNNSSRLRLGRTGFYRRVLFKACTNGSSELMTNLSASVVNSLFNLQLMKFSGENGVAAFGTIMYASFIFNAIYFGYAIGSAPIISYQYGADNEKEMKNMFKKSLLLVAVWAVALVGLAQVIAAPLASLFVGYDAELYALTSHGFRQYSKAFLLSGFNIFGSAFFTALNNGLLSAVISFLRTLVFQMAAVLILPIHWGIDGIWNAVTVAEILTFFVTAALLIGQRKRYRYV